METPRASAGCRAANRSARSGRLVRKVRKPLPAAAPETESAWARGAPRALLFHHNPALVKQFAGLRQQVEEAAADADLRIHHCQLGLRQRLLREDHVLVGFRAELVFLVFGVHVLLREIELDAGELQLL